MWVGDLLFLTHLRIKLSKYTICKLFNEYSWEQNQCNTILIPQGLEVFWYFMASFWCYTILFVRCILFFFRFIQMSSRTAAANSFSLTNYKIPLLCNACMYIKHISKSIFSQTFTFNQPINQIVNYTKFTLFITTSLSLKFVVQQSR